MKVITQRLYSSSSLTKASEWGKLITITGAAQVLVQAVGFICGILVIRCLPTQEYALYTLANTMLGTMTVLADGGISTGVTAQGGKVWQDREKLGVVLVTGLALRKKFAIGSLLIAIPVMLYLFRHHGASWLVSLLIILSLIPTFLSALSGAILQVAPKLQQDIAPLQRNQVEANLLRLALLGLTIFIFPLAFVVILAAGLPQVWANSRLRKISARYADWSQPSDPGVRNEILVFVKRLLPGAVYYCLSGQISIWLISLFGSTAAVAQVGALSRLTMVLSLFSMLFNMLIVPRFARLPGIKALLLDKYLKVQLYLVVTCSFIVGLAWLFPSQVLWVLGKEYAGLTQELLLNIVGNCLNLIVGINYSLNSNRGWIMHPLIGILIGMAGIIGGVWLVDVSTLRGVLLFNVFTGVVGLFIHPMYGLIKILKGASG